MSQTIISPESLQNLKKKIYTKLNNLTVIGAQATDETFVYNPKAAIIYSHFLYLSEKYGKICLPKRKPYPNKIFDLTTVELSSNRKQMARLEHTIRIFIENIMNCIADKKKTFVFPFTVEFSTTYHQNLLIYRRNTRTIEENTIHTIEHFEPNASSTLLSRENYKALNEIIYICVDQLRDEFGDNLIFVEQSQVCPVGLQTIESSHKKGFQKEGGGYCLAWSALMTELILENQEYDSKTIVETVMSAKDHLKSQTQSPSPDTSQEAMFSHYLRDVIRGYAMTMEKKIEKYYKKEFGLTKPVWEETNVLFEKIEPIYLKTAKKGLSRRKKRQTQKYKKLFENVSIYEESSPESIPTLTPKTPTKKSPTKKSPTKKSPTKKSPTKKSPKYTRKTPPSKTLDHSPTH